MRSERRESASDQLETRRYRVCGIVQGVGFRPFVVRVAARHALAGWVRNDSDGVLLEIRGRADALEAFVHELCAGPPALARIDSLALLDRHDGAEPAGSFEIHASAHTSTARTLIPPDTSVCEDCLRELFDLQDRRHRYPYINCTNCGPRYTIVRGLPYDRETTTMAGFPMCRRCRSEFEDLSDRRFHAQPIACWDCGPRLTLLRAGEALPASRQPHDADPIRAAAALLRDGAIAAVKGIGGYHLMADARNRGAIAELRRRKHREHKPFAVMFADLDGARRHAYVEAVEAEQLAGARRPIVLVRKRAGGGGLADGIAPRSIRYGAMLAYTPVHHLLFAEGFDALVATSGNVSEEPIAFDDADALARLAQIADAFLVGEREIFTRADDSIVHVMGARSPHTQRRRGPRGAGGPTVVRRARGYVPEPVKAPFELPPLLALGAELKSAICLGRGTELFLSEHLGDLKNEATLRSFELAIQHWRRLLGIEPDLLAHDMHPGYLSTRHALGHKGAQRTAVQHHHAHMAACMCEHGLTGRVIGVVFDGAGYGSDGNIWGGELLVGDYASFERAAHLRYFPVPGGDSAVATPYRVAYALLHQACDGDLDGLDLSVLHHRTREERRMLGRMLESGVGSPMSSSAGRLFDAVAALIGVRERSHYEAQAAIELEQLIEPGAQAPALPWRLHDRDGWPWQVDLRATVKEIARLVARREADAAELSLRFHCTVVEVVRGVCVAIRQRTGVDRVVLSGGVFQNEFLLHGCLRELASAGFRAYAHRLVPPNDGGIALGQAAVAGWRAR
jgi:hydrogenase maturation protein HypF